jgi:uncharacterized protein (TIGR03546 family)
MRPSRFQTPAVMRLAATILLANGSQRQLAVGATLGMILGLVPKDNLIAAGLFLLLLMLKVNKGVGLSAAVLFSFLGPMADPFTHKLGRLVLGYEPLQGAFAALYDAPLAPWLGFNNTVVMGSLLVGLYAAYPVYWLTRTCLAWLMLGEAPLAGGSTRGAAL